MIHCAPWKQWIGECVRVLLEGVDEDGEDGGLVEKLVEEEKWDNDGEAFQI